MSPAETSTVLRQFNKWLRGNKDGPQLESREINQAINAAIEMLERLEAAERERDSYRVAHSRWAEKTEWVQRGFNEGTISAKYLGMHRADVMARLLDEALKECNALRAKLEATEEDRSRFILEMGRLCAQCDALRAKIEAMEKRNER